MANIGPSDSPIHTFTTDRQRWKKLKGFACENRKKPILAEAQLWQGLRTNRLGPRFRRQHAIDDYIVDFVCLAAWLVVEVDGEIYQVPEQAEYDGGRTHALQERGFLVARYSNEEVLQQLPKVLADIERHLKLLLG